MHKNKTNKTSQKIDKQTSKQNHNGSVMIMSRTAISFILSFICHIEIAIKHTLPLLKNWE